MGNSMMTLMQKYTVQRWINIYNHYVCAYNEITSPETKINTPDENIVVNHKKKKMLMYIRLNLVCWRLSATYI